MDSLSFNTPTLVMDSKASASLMKENLLVALLRVSFVARDFHSARWKMKGLPITVTSLNSLRMDSNDM